MSHFIELCKVCGDVISQCRCPDSLKEKRYGICEKCKKNPKLEHIPPVIGITGKKRCGKDTICEILTDLIPPVVHSYFAKPLKDAVAAMFVFSQEQVNGDKKETFDPFWKTTPRLILQKFGTDLIRNKLVEAIPELGDIGPGFWVMSMEKWYLQQYLPSQDLLMKSPFNGVDRSSNSLILTDTRFPNESAFIHKYGGKVIKVIRNTGLTDDHSSETQDVPYDYLIENNGTIEELKKKVEQIVKGWA